MSDVRKGWLCHRVVRWQEPTAALDDTGPHRLQIFDSELGLWLTLAQVQVEEDAMAQGIPVLRGPYVVDYTDIPHDGDTKVLWTPQVGDVLLHLWQADSETVAWDHGHLTLKQGTQVIRDTADFTGGDNWLTDVGSFVVPTADPFEVVFVNTSATSPGGIVHDPTVGRVGFYALVARAVAP